MVVPAHEDETEGHRLPGEAGGDVFEGGEEVRGDEVDVEDRGSGLEGERDCVFEAHQVGDSIPLRVCLAYCGWMTTMENLARWVSRDDAVNENIHRLLESQQRRRRRPRHGTTDSRARRDDGEDARTLCIAEAYLIQHATSVYTYTYEVGTKYEYVTRI